VARVPPVCLLDGYGAELDAGPVDKPIYPRRGDPPSTMGMDAIFAEPLRPGTAP